VFKQERWIALVADTPVYVVILPLEVGFVSFIVISNASTNQHKFHKKGATSLKVLPFCLRIMR
jgi:hypothetical protein